MDLEELRKLRKHEVTHSTYKFEFDGADSWLEFMTNLGKQLDKLKIPMNDAAKIVWDGGDLTIHCLKVWTLDENKKRKRLD